MSLEIYVRADVPDYCYVFEATYWMAIGRVPESSLTEVRGSAGEKWIDQRWDPETFAVGDLANVEMFGFHEHEFRLVSAQIDYDRYYQILTEHVILDPEFVQEKILQMTNDEPKAARAADDVMWASSQESIFTQWIDRAWVKLFESLASGEIEARGWKACSLDKQKIEDGYVGELSAIPREEWILKNFDFEATKLRFANGFFYGVQVPTQRLMELFSEPLVGSSILSASQVGDTLIVENSQSTLRQNVAQKRPRGRPTKAQGDQRQIVVNVFADKIRRGDVPKKREALLQEIMDFIGVACRQRIGRTAAQDYLKAAEEKNSAGK